MYFNHGVLIFQTFTSQIKASHMICRRNSGIDILSRRIKWQIKQSHFNQSRISGRALVTALLSKKKDSYQFNWSGLRIRLNPQHFGFLDPDPQKYADPRIRFQGQINNQKLKLKSELLKKERLSKMSALNKTSSCCIKKVKKVRKIYRKSILLLKKSVNLK